MVERVKRTNERWGEWQSLLEDDPEGGGDSWVDDCRVPAKGSTRPHCCEPRARRRLAQTERPDARTLPVAAAVALAPVLPLVLLATEQEQAQISHPGRLRPLRIKLH